MGLDGTKMLVVGGSAGIGRAIGERAVASGAQVVFAARRLDRLGQVVAEAGGGHAVVLDVTDESSVVDGVAGAVDLLGGLDVVVYSSGVGSIARVVDETADNWQRMFAVNVIGAALVAREVIPQLRERGIMYFCSSTNTHRRLWGLAGYGASKAAFDRLIEGLRDEHPEFRFVRAVIGTTIGTEFGDHMDAALIGEALPRWVVAGQQTAGMMTPDQLAAVSVDVLSTLRAHSEIEIPVLPLDPAGGPLLLPATADVLATAFAALDPE